MRPERSDSPRSHRTRLGELLVRYGAERTKIDTAGETFYAQQARLFGEFCVSRGACTREQLEMALAEQAIERGDFDSAHQSVIEALERVNRKKFAHLETMAMQIDLLVSGLRG